MMIKSKRKIIAYLLLVFTVSILLMALWISLRNTNLPSIFLYVGTTILYVATFAGLLRGIIWTVEHFVKWIQNENKEDEA